METAAQSPGTRAPVPFTACVLLAVALLGTACSGAGSASAPAGTDPVIRLEPVASFGCDDCEGPEQLATPGVTVGASGRTYIVETHEPFVRVLGPDGALELAVGVAGEGPGEIRLAFLLGVVEDGAGGFWVQEAMFLHHFDATGAALASEPYRGRLPSGWAYDQDRQRIYVVGGPLPLPGSQRGERMLVRYSPGSPEPEEVAPWEVVTQEPPGETPPETTRWSTLAVAPDGRIAIVDIWNYRVRVLSQNGTLLAEFGRPDLPRPRKSEERIAAERKQGASLGAAGYDGAGRLWLQALRGPGLLDVFGPDGSLLAEIDVGERLGSPGGWPSLGVYGDRVAVIVQDDLGVATVRLYRIVEE